MTHQKIAGLNLPNLHPKNKLFRILSSTLETKLSQSKDIEIDKFPVCSYWEKTYFNLDKIKIFQDSTAEEQQKILHLCNFGLLEEAYFIEKAGVGYMAKMVAFAESTEERMLYALFSADEATHLAQISRFLPSNELVTTQPFLRLLEDVVESQDKAVLLFVLQVILEGWGLSHYRNLAQACQNENLASVLRGFLQDESRHHGIGIKLFDQITITKSSQETIIETLAMFLQMVQVGPQSVVAAIEKVKGHLSRSQKLQIFQELDTEAHSGSRLLLLRSLMRTANAKLIVKELETQGAFQPLPAEKCIIN